MAHAAIIPAPDGRALEVEVAGPEDGRVVLFHNGTPSAGSVFGPLIDAGAERGLRHVGYSRPGYGRSDRHEGRSVADCAADVAAIAGHLGIREFFTVGVSGGGPHALACAALLGDRVLAAATIGSVAPYDAPGLDWTAGMGQENIEELAAMRAGPDALREYLESQRQGMLGASGTDIERALAGLLSDVDRQALSGEFADYIAHTMSNGLAPGIWGWFDDDIAHMGEWGFELGSIAPSVTIWQGRQDLFVPFAHGQWLAANLPGARAQLLDEHGHLSLSLAHYGDVLDDLLAR